MTLHRPEDPAETAAWERDKLPPRVRTQAERTAGHVRLDPTAGVTARLGVALEESRREVQRLHADNDRLRQEPVEACLMHPYIRWAIAACWSLHTALTALELRAKDAAADATAGSRVGEVSIPSQVFGRRTALGGHGDPTAVQALGAWAPGGPNPDAALLGDLMRQLDEMAQHLPGAPGMDPLTRIRQAIPTMRPDVAARTCEAVGHLDGIARRKLQMPPDRRRVDGRPPCPACRQRLLYVQTSGPGEVWTVICGGGCVCSGDGCGCGMPVRVEGVAHIWDRTAPIVAAALNGTHSV